MKILILIFIISGSISFNSYSQTMLEHVHNGVEFLNKKQYEKAKTQFKNGIKALSANPDGEEYFYLYQCHYFTAIICFFNDSTNCKKLVESLKNLDNALNAAFLMKESKSSSDEKMSKMYLKCTKEIEKKKLLIYNKCPDLEPKDYAIKEPHNEQEKKSDFQNNLPKADDKTVTLTVSGQGKTQDEAKQVALRSAIEQAFGAFISSKTEILNDNLIKDEIVSVTNGNIQKFEPISEVQLPDGSYATILKAIVSVSKLTSFCESKGVEVEFKGATFAMNIKLQKLNEEAEYKAILNLCEISRRILAKGLDFNLEVADPISYGNSSSEYIVKLKVNCTTNKNYQEFINYFWKTLPQIAMSQEEKLNYNKIEKKLFSICKAEFLNYKVFPHGFTPYYQLKFIKRFYFRNEKSVWELHKLMVTSNKILTNFKICSEIDTIAFSNGNFAYNDSYDHRSYNVWKLLDHNASYPLGTFSDYGVRDDGNYFFSTNVFPLNYFGFGDNAYNYKWIPTFELAVCTNFNILPFILTYSNILNLNQLEKISKYKIEPWENK